MLKSTERKSMEELNGLTKPRDGLWKKAPTPITKPSNNPRTAHPSGGNPYSTHQVGKRNTQKSKAVGNQTANQTLTRNTARPSFGKPKADSTFADSSSYSNYGRPHRSSATSEAYFISSEDDDPIVVSASTSAAASAGVKRTHADRQSSDPLNMKSREPSPLQQQSKYPFSQHRSTKEDKRKCGLVPDGKNTKRIEEQYGNQNQDKTSSIESFGIDGHDGVGVFIREAGRTRGNVAALRGIFEPGPNVNLQEKLKDKMKSKSQTTKAQLQKLGNSQDPVATNTTLFRKATPKFYSTPLIEVYLDKDKYTEGNLQASFNTDTLLAIQRGGEELLNLSDWVGQPLELQYTDGVDPPMMQIQLTTRSDTITLTLKTQSNRTKSIKNEKLRDHLRQKIKNSYVLRTGEGLQAVADRLVEMDMSDEGSTAKEPPSKKIKLLPPRGQAVSIPSNGSAYRTSGFKDEASESVASGSTSKSKSNPPSNARAAAPRRSIRNAPPAKPVDQDKVILVYPQGIPGAVNITNGDLARLQPGEYLNDTLIEFGLKLWLQQLREKQPELADQIHIFNSFFYKKLNAKKNEVQAFETVRKWTSKFDIFKKKYIVVPINEHMHWYLAIIYEPEHVLSTTAPDEAPKRKLTRLAAKVDEPISVVETEPQVISAALSATSSEAEVEHDLGVDFENSCSIDTAAVDVATTKKADATMEEDDLSDMYATDPDDPPRRPVDQANNAPPGHSKQASVDNMDVDESKFEIIHSDKDDSVTELEAIASTSKPNTSRPIPPHIFYGSAKSKGKQKAKPEVIVMDVDETQKNNPKTYIFTFDSLGTNHPHAIKKLGQYLRMEAKDKKDIPNAGVASGKAALVPVQPNFCDCGVYLLHFAHTFLTAPTKYFNVIMSQAKNVSNEEKQKTWNDTQVADIRAQLTNEIEERAKIWKALKDAEIKESEQIDAVDNSDSDINMTSPVKKSNRAARIRG